jgi:hypothetical protein
MMNMSDCLSCIEMALAERLTPWVPQHEQRGIEKGEALLLRRQLMRRFGALPEWAEQRLSQATTVQLETWGDQVLDAATLTEVLGHPGH